MEPEWILGGIVVLVLGALGWGIWDEVHAEKFCLRNDGWSCTRTVERTYLQYQPALKMSLPVVTDECVEYVQK